ncbi:MAG TPA: glycosyltransferase family 39 protein [Jatrophihabitans sp.]|nr:glycosyltransferase family 39 protein [Jatrophihabitans sp.]
MASTWLGTHYVAVRFDDVLVRFDRRMTSAADRVLRPRPRRDWLLAPGLVLLVAAALRLFALDRVGLNSDEAVYAGQSASLADNPHFTPLFPIVRAHPLTMQLLMSPFYRTGVPDVPGRYVAALFGVGTVALVYVLGSVMYGPRVGLVASAVLAVMPYHVIVSRQIMLDGPMAFFATAALTCLALAASGPARNGWLIAAGGFIGLAALTKETAFTLAVAAFVFLSLVNFLWRPARFPLIGAGAALLLTLVYPIVTSVSGGSGGGQSYLLWQLTRQPNHDFSFYPVVVGASMGFAVLLVAALGVLMPRLTGRRFTWREMLLLSWVLVPLLFFVVWPVKGFTYLMPLAPAVAVLAARTLLPLPAKLTTHRRRLVAALIAVVTFASLLVPAVEGVMRPTRSGLAGAGGVPGGREAGRWVNTHVPFGARLMTIGPSMANILQYYSARHCDGLSVSPNPLHRNPSYHAIANADAELRNGDYQYVVWDVYSARRSPHFAARAMDLVHRYSGRAVYTGAQIEGGRPVRQVIVIYQVIP